MYKRQIVLSHPNSLLIFAGDITIAFIEVKGNSATGKGIRVESASAKIVNLTFSATDPDLANMRLTFSNDTFSLEVENLNVNSPAQLTGDVNGGWLNVILLCAGTRDNLGNCTDNTKILTLHDINVKVVEAINIDFTGQIVMTGSSYLSLIHI